MKQMKQIIKSHSDPITVPVALRALEQEYLKEGWEVKHVSPSMFQLLLKDGTVNVYWQDGVFWQEIEYTDECDGYRAEEN